MPSKKVVVSPMSLESGSATTVETRPLRVGFVSLGCPKNLVDSEVMMGLLARGGAAPRGSLTAATGIRRRRVLTPGASGHAGAPSWFGVASCSKASTTASNGCLTETGLLTSDRAGCSPARVAGKTAAVSLRHHHAGLFPCRFPCRPAPVIRLPARAGWSWSARPVRRRRQTRWSWSRTG